MRIIALFFAGLLAVAVAGCGGHAAAIERSQCPTLPVCRSGGLLRPWRCWTSSAYNTGRDADKEAMAANVHEVLQQVKGQAATIAGIERALLHKIANPQQPLIMQFSGDNGVGKTHTANLISLALSLRCGDPLCTVGDSMLVISGTGFDGMEPEAMRRALVGDIARHAMRFPHGLVLLNDVQSFPEVAYRILLPLLGRSHQFGEYPNVDLRALTVILTNDFGREGVTRGKTLEQITAMALAECRQHLSQLAVSNLRSFVFLPITMLAAEEIVAFEIEQLPCRHSSISRVSFGVDVPSFLAVKAAENKILTNENGRALQMLVQDTVDGVVNAKLFRHPKGIRCAAHIAVSADGSDLRVSVSEESSEHLEL